MMWISRRGDCDAATVREERQKVGACVPRGGLPDHLAGLGVQRSVEREGAVPLVFEAVALRSAGRQREARVDAVERLNRRLFVETEYAACCGGARYRPSTSAAFVAKSGSVDPCIVRSDGAQPRALPRALHKGVTAELQRRRQRPRAPLRGAVRRRYRPAKPGTRPSRNRCFHLAIVRELSPRRIKSA